MSSKLIPADPSSVMVIRAITPNITTFSAPFRRFGRIKIGGRGTAIKLQNNTVAVFSPTALTPDVKRTVEGLGEVKYLAALDIEHHIFLNEWYDAYPNATVIGMEGLPEKRAKDPEQARVPFGHVFTTKDRHPSIDAAFDAEFDAEYVPSHMNRELVFCHKPSRTLVQADLIFNLPATEQYSRSNEDPNTGFLTRLFCSLQNTKGNAIWQRRMIYYFTSKGNGPRSDFDKSMQRISAWNFDRMIPCHGDVIETGAKGVFAKVMEWHLKGKQT